MKGNDMIENRKEAKDNGVPPALTQLLIFLSTPLSAKSFMKGERITEYNGALPACARSSGTTTVPLRLFHLRILLPRLKVNQMKRISVIPTHLIKEWIDRENRIFVHPKPTFFLSLYPTNLW